MVSLSTWFRYITHKFDYSVSLAWKRYTVGQITERQVGDYVWKNLLQGKLTYLHCNNGVESVPTIPGLGGTLLVRKLPTPDPKHVFVGDVVVLKDPVNSGNHLVRRLAAIEGYEMVSKDEKDTLYSRRGPVLGGFRRVYKTKARDSRSFGPVNMTDIVGRVIYSLQTVVDHGPVQNSPFGMQKDSSVLAVELDTDEMARNTRA